MRRTSQLLQSLFLTAGFFLCLSMCAYSVAGMMHPIDRVPAQPHLRARRDIVEALQPTLVVVGRDKGIVTTGTAPGDVQEIEIGGLASSPIPDVVPEEDEPLTGIPALQDPSEDTLGPLDSSFIEADSATVQDTTTFLGTEAVETGTTPPPPA